MRIPRSVRTRFGGRAGEQRVLGIGGIIGIRDACAVRERRDHLVVDDAIVRERG